MPGIKGVFGKTGNIWILWLFECFNNICDAYACVLTTWYNLELTLCREITLWVLSNFHEYASFTKYK